MPVPWPRGDDTKLEYQQDNPKRPGSVSYDRYEQYKSSKTLREAKANGAGSADFTHDYNKGLLKILPNQDGEAASSSAGGTAASKQPARSTAKSAPTAKPKAKSSADGKSLAEASPKAAAQRSSWTSEAADAPQTSTGTNGKSSAEIKGSPSGSKRKLDATGTTPAESSTAASSSSSSAAPQKLDTKDCWLFLPSMRAHIVEFRDTATVQEAQAAQDASKKARTVAAVSGHGKGKDRQRKMFGLRSMRNRKEEKKDKKHKKHKKDKKDKKSKKEKKHKKEKKEKAEKKSDKVSEEENGLKEKKDKAEKSEEANGSKTEKTSSQVKRHSGEGAAKAKRHSIALSGKRRKIAAGSGSSTTSPGTAATASEAAAAESVSAAKGGAATSRSVAAVAKAAAKLLGAAKLFGASKAKSPSAAAASAAKAKPPAAASSSAAKTPPPAAAKAPPSAAAAAGLQKAAATAWKAKASPPASAAAFATKASPQAAAAASGARTGLASATKSPAARPTAPPPPKAGAAADVDVLQGMIDKLDNRGFDRVLGFLTAAANMKGDSKDASTYTVELSSLSSEMLKQLTRLVQEEHERWERAKVAKASVGSSSVPFSVAGPKGLLAADAQRHREAAAQSPFVPGGPAAWHPQAIPPQQAPPRPPLYPGVAPRGPGALTRPGAGYFGDTGAAAMTHQAQASQPPLVYPGVPGIRTMGLPPQALPPQPQPGQYPFNPGFTQQPLQYRSASAWDAQAHMPGPPPAGPTQLHPSGYGQTHEDWSGQDAQRVDGWSLHPGLPGSGPGVPHSHSEYHLGYPSGMGSSLSSGGPTSHEDLPYLGDGGGWAPGAGPSAAHQPPRIMPGDTHPPGPCDERCNCAQSAGVPLRQGALDKPWVREERRKAVAESMQNFSTHAGVIMRGKVSRQHRFQPAAPGWHERQAAAKHRTSQTTAAPIVVAPDDGTPPRQSN